MSPDQLGFSVVIRPPSAKQTAMGFPVAALLNRRGAWAADGDHLGHAIKAVVPHDHLGCLRTALTN